MNIIRMTAEQVAERNARKSEEIRKFEEAEYERMFGYIPTKEQRHDWFRCDPKFGPQMKHG